MGSVDCEVKLIGGYRSPFVARARIALKLKHVEFKILEEKLGKKSEILLESNPILKLAPVLLHRGKPVCESLLIVQYIDEVWASHGPPIMPLDPYDRAVACFWASYIDQKWIPSLNNVLTSNLKEEEANPEALKQVEEGVFLLEDVFNKINNGKPFFSGKDWIGYLDIAFGSSLYRLKVLEMMNNVNILNESKTPGLARWSDNFLADPVVKSVLVGVDETMELFKLIAEMILSSASVPNATTDTSVTTTPTVINAVTNGTSIDHQVDNTVTKTVDVPVDSTSVPTTVVGSIDRQVNNSVTMTIDVPVDSSSVPTTVVASIDRQVNNSVTKTIDVPVGNTSVPRTIDASIDRQANNTATTTIDVPIDDKSVTKTGAASIGTVVSVAFVDTAGVVRG